MTFRWLPLACAVLAVGVSQHTVHAQSSASSRHTKKSPAADSALDAGSISNGVYRNRFLAFSCAIPPSWVLRTEEISAHDANEPADATQADGHPESLSPTKSQQVGRVLLAAFSRPPEARGEDINSSILIAAESASAYPGLKEAAQYFGPVSEVAKARGFAVLEEPYEFAVGARKLVRGDFQKDVGTRVMRQSTLVMLAGGYAVSFTFIAGTEDEIEELIAGLAFQGSAPASQAPPK
jgi:hypothetical protein